MKRNEAKEPQGGLESAGPRLRRNKEKILERWLAATREKVHLTGKYSDVALKNSLPDLIDKIVSTLSSGDLKKSSEIRDEMEIAREHGKQRVQLGGYSLEEIVDEYNIFRQTLFATLEEEGPIEIRERDVLLDAVIFCIQKAVSEFSRIEHSHRDRVEESLKRSHEDLDRKVRERTSQVLSMEQERQLREQFVSMLSHDLRTPLTVIRTSAQLLARYPDRIERAPTLLGRIIDSVDRSDQMIRDLLDANRVRAGETLPLKIEAVNLNELTQDICEELSSAYGRKFQVEASQKIQGYWDRGGIRRVLENLMKNAQKYGSVTTSITIHLELRGSEVQIAVHNWGNPISTEERGSLFEPFRQSRSAETSVERGWGLGLTLVRGMAEAHGGKVGVESSEAKGTTFTVTIPLDSKKVIKADEQMSR